MGQMSFAYAMGETSVGEMSVGELSVREITILVFFMNNVVLNALNTSSFS